MDQILENIMMKEDIMIKKIFLTVLMLTLVSLTGCERKEDDFQEYLDIILIQEGEFIYSNTVSLRITEVDNKKISGTIAIKEGVARPECYSDDSLTWPEELGTFSGIIQNGNAECTFENEKGDKGELLLVLEEDTIKVYIEMVQTRKGLEGEELTREYILKKYNIEDLAVPSALEYYETDKERISIQFRGQQDVYFVAGVQKDLASGRCFPCTFLTNTTGDILYEFHPGYVSGTKVVNFFFEDLNQDGLIDVVINTAFLEENGQAGCEEVMEWSFCQLENGYYYLNQCEEKLLKK